VRHIVLADAHDDEVTSAYNLITFGQLILKR
jgi:hypothetical protein